jgi:hypothetical protein
MTLTKEQIEIIKGLISKKGYQEIDVQYEILDHVACKIEDMIQENPQLSIEDAFSKVHASFGIFGFLELEESYIKAIYTKSNQYTWKALLNIWSSWRIILPILLTLIFFHLSSLVNEHLETSTMGFLIVFFSMILLLLALWYRPIIVNSKKYRKFAYWKYNTLHHSTPFLGVYLLMHFRNLEHFKILDSATWNWVFIFPVLLVFAMISYTYALRKSLDNSTKRMEELEKIYS